MKKIVLSILLISGVLFASSQSDSLANKPPYLRFPTPPPVKLLLIDSVTYFTKENLDKNAPLMYILFNPDCEHCQKETEEILDSIDKFKGVEIIMATFMPFEKMKEFYDRYKLSNYSNIVVGKDINFFLPPFYKVANLPFLAFYNKKHQLISVFEGSHPVTMILDEFRKDQ